jgi:hypothetical protein
MRMVSFGGQNFASKATVEESRRPLYVQVMLVA